MTRSLTRRRFLAISAAALAGPANASPIRWQGHALGAEIGLTLHAPAPQAELAIQQTRNRLRDIERLFSLYDPNSTLSVLNRDGLLPEPPALFRDLMNACTRMNRATYGVFDPTIQSLWHAIATGAPTDAARRAVGWQRVHIDDTIRLGPGQALTFNGIAQGFATDLIRADLARIGLDHALINIGELSALGGPFRIGLADPVRGIFATQNLENRAIATSSASAMRLGAASHILHPVQARPVQWATVSVEADSATQADAASTAFTLMTRTEISASKAQLPGDVRVTLLSEAGDIETL
ncbi:FAD:protein FMN transferase [Ruegeria sediminis]|uniref:FAD:protein FMN transferase n=1 Tax=Ruegeria sediminis TaxID=2583820 RepID=A0ABY2X1M2_9RHOB|nr:FAD:protein FMN transferase [Ruegeria sediminis]TMV09097.1 FAD:protein FMN transferase [Ruegeria sediminis]